MPAGKTEAFIEKERIYEAKLKQALSNSIEVAEESEELATVLFATASNTEPMNITSADGCDEEWFFDFDHLEGQMFPIEGLTYTREHRPTSKDSFRFVAIINK